MLLDREFPPDIRVENEAHSLIQAGHEVHLLCYDHQNKAKDEHLRGINIHRFKINKQIAKKSLGFILNLPIYKWIWEKQVNALLQKESFDAVHIHDLPLCILISSIRRSGIPVISDMHENYPFLVAEQSYMRSSLGRAIFRYKHWFRKESIWLSQSNAIICVAPEMKNRLENALGRGDNIHIVPNTFSFDSFGSKQIEISELKSRINKKHIVLYVGGFDHGRGLDILITAINHIKHRISDFALVLVGDGTIKDELIQLVDSFSIQDLVYFEGWKPASHVKSYIEVSSVCVIPHLKSEQTDNSSPNKLFQYMFFERAVVSSNCTSLEKIIAEENCGLIFKDRDPKDLAEKIYELIKTPELAALMGANGKAAVVAKYNWETTVQPLLVLYASLKK